MNAGHRQSTLRELQRFFRSPRYWATIAVVVLVFTVTGPFGTREAMPPLQRLCFWALLHTMAFSIALVLATMVDLALHRIIASRLVRMLIGSALAAMPIGFGITLLQAGFVGEPISWNETLEQAGISLPLCLCLCLLTYLTTATGAAVGVAGDENTTGNTAADVSIDTEPAPVQRHPQLLQRLKPDNRGRLLRLSVQDHYTEVVTSRGRELVLLRFSDALNELGGVEGRRIHRSHWVADEHVVELRRDEGRLALATRDGTILPVSRPYEAEVRARFQIR